MRRIQPKGPYLLAGYSLGGTIAFEMAQQLIKGGDFVAKLIIFDTSAPITEYQQLEIGDTIAEGPDGYFTVTILNPNQALVLHSIRHPLTGQPLDLNARNYLDFSWAFVLKPINDNSTRLIIRVRLNYRLNIRSITES